MSGLLIKKLAYVFLVCDPCFLPFHHSAIQVSQQEGDTMSAAEEDKPAWQ